MFGGLTFMIGGNMSCGVNGNELIVRLDPAGEHEALARPHARPMDLTGRPCAASSRCARRPEGRPTESMGARSRRPSRITAAQVVIGSEVLERETP